MLQVQAREAAADALTVEKPAAAVLDFMASSETLDRYHEIIEPGGWQLETYRRNPVFQNAHNYGDILFTLGKALVTEVRDLGDARRGLFQRVEFATDVNPVARIAYGLYRGGFLNAVSVGFIPLRWENGSAEAGYRRKYLEQELLEVSAVAIPANPDALALGVKSGAVEKADLKETLALLREVAGPTAWPGGDEEVFSLARELRRILRRA
jgi:HK97 family phage prohead protease